MKLSKLFIMETMGSMYRYNICMKSTCPLLYLWRSSILFLVLLLELFFETWLGYRSLVTERSWVFVYSQGDKGSSASSTNVSFYSCLMYIHYTHAFMGISETLQIKRNKVCISLKGKYHIPKC